jgi:hypothetical protein
VLLSLGQGAHRSHSSHQKHFYYDGLFSAIAHIKREVVWRGGEGRTCVCACLEGGGQAADSLYNDEIAGVVCGRGGRAALL